jgi:hypothetical protein
MSNKLKIDDMNEAIAIFDGWDKRSQQEFIKDGYMRYVWEFKYHKSWDQLMPVIENISKMPLENAFDYSDTCFPRTFGMPAPDGQVMVRLNGFSCHKADTLIEAAYMAVYEVAEYHNKQQSNEQA